MLERALYRPDTPSIVLVSADVVQGEYRSASYAYRTHPELRLTGVPTLYRWGRDGPTARLVEREITDASVAALIGGGRSA